MFKKFFNWFATGGAEISPIYKIERWCTTTIDEFGSGCIWYVYFNNRTTEFTLVISETDDFYTTWDVELTAMLAKIVKHAKENSVDGYLIVVDY